MVPLRDEEDWRDAERHLLDAAKAESTPFMEEAGRQMKLLEQTALLEGPSLEPRVTTQLPDADRVQLVLDFPPPIVVARALNRRFFLRYLISMC